MRRKVTTWPQLGTGFEGFELAIPTAPPPLPPIPPRPGAPIYLYCRCRRVERQDIVSMMVMCNDIDITDIDERRSGLSSAALDTEYDRQ